MYTPSAKLFFESAKCKYNLLISTWTLEELSRKIEPDQIKMLFEIVRNKIIKVEVNEEDKKKAHELYSKNFPDALHIVLAEKSHADFIVTRNFIDFIKIGTNIELKKPEHLV